MPGFNDKLADTFTHHAVSLERFSGGLRIRTFRTYKELKRELTKKLHAPEFQAARLKYDVRRQRNHLRELLAWTDEQINLYYGRMKKQTFSELKDLAILEDKFTRQSINQLSPIELATVGVSPEQLRAIMSDAVIEGHGMGKLWTHQSATLKRRYMDTVRSGLIQGKPTEEIIADLDRGGFAIAGRDLESLVRTSVASVSNAARMEVYANLRDVVGYVQQRSILDPKTSDICKAYSNKVWTNDRRHEPVGHNLPFRGGVPRHWRCRSTIIPVVKSWEELFGTEPTKGQQLAEYKRALREEGFTEKEIKKITFNSQASMDGAVAADIDYETWLRSKGTAFQKRILGDDKYRLWKKGKITFEDLVDGRGNPLTIDELYAELGLKKPSR